MSTLSDSQRQAINAAIFNSLKIQAIKLYREAAGCDLKDAKDFVDALELKLRQEQPAQFHQAGSHTGNGSGCGTTTALLLIMILGAGGLLSWIR